MEIDYIDAIKELGALALAFYALKQIDGLKKEIRDFKDAVIAKVT